jgi:hypothetical protein
LSWWFSGFWRSCKRQFGKSAFVLVKQRVISREINRSYCKFVLEIPGLSIPQRHIFTSQPWTVTGRDFGSS